MNEEGQSGGHSAEAAALGFYYQAFFALLTLVAQDTDNASIGIEQLDDVDLKANGHTLLYQLKHSICAAPPPITLASRALWRTVKIWIDILPAVNLSETTFHLVAVAAAERESTTRCASSVIASTRLSPGVSRSVSASSGLPLGMAPTANKALPYADRVNGCEAFLSLSRSERLNLMRRIIIRPDSPTVSEIEGQIPRHLTILPADQRPVVAKRLVEWWDRQIIYSLCGKRDRVVSRTELQYQISAIIADIEQGRLTPDFETASPPEEYQPDGILARQIKLVEGRPSDLSKAIREEWKAREQRSKWLNDNPAMAATINNHDIVLIEHWSDRHCQMVEDCESLEHKDKCASGLRILRWTHEEAPNVIRPIAEGWNAAYYIRGSYQVLAINLTVGWHPEYRKMLGGKK